MSDSSIPRIVLVDDDADFLSSLADAIRRHDYDVVDCANGAAAIAALQARPCDVLVTDLNMPGMDGVALLQAALAVDPNLIVILMTANADVGSAVESMKLGAFDYLVKPFPFKALNAALERSLGVRRLRRENLQLRETVAIHELCRTMAFSEDARDVVNTLADAAWTQTEADNASILLASDDCQEFVVAAARGPGADALVGRRMPIADGIAGWVAQHREHVVIQGAADDPPFGAVKSRPEIESAICQPMLAGGKVVGVVNVSRQRPGRPFAASQTRALGILANTAAAALQARRLIDALHLRNEALDAAANAIVITDRSGTIQWVNKAFSKLTGYSPEEAIGGTPRLLRSGQHDSAFYGKVWQTVLAGEVWTGEMINRRKDGSLYYEEQMITPVRGQDGALTHFIAIKQDITRRKQSEADLEERARLAALSAGVGLALASAQNLRDMLQQCALALVHNLPIAGAHIWTLLAKEQVLHLQASAGQEPPSHGLQDRLSLVDSPIGRIAQLRRPHVENNPAVAASSSAAPAGPGQPAGAFAGYPLLVADELVGVMALTSRQAFSPSTLDALDAIATKIAVGIKRKQAETAREEFESRLRAFIDRARDILFDVDVEGRFLALNPSFETTTGWPARDWIGKSFEPLLQPEDVELGRSYFVRALGGEQLPYFELRLRSAGGAKIDVEVTATPSLVGDKIVGVNGIARDITVRKQLEEQLRQAQKIEAIGKLAGGVAHDFNNLLTVIQGYSELILAQLPAQNPIRDMIQQIHQSGERAARLTRQLLAFSRKQVLQPVVLNVNMLLTEMEKMLRRLIGENIELTLALDPELHLIKIDAGQLEQVVMNLVINARDAIDHQGRITIETANVALGDAGARPGVPPGEFVRLSIRDTGCGMDAATKARIFEPFFSTKGERGTGLGLATVLGIIEQFGGRIEVDSAPGAGTTFRIVFPRLVTSGATSHVVAPPPPMPCRGCERILLVEDEDEVRELTGMILSARGYDVIPARNGGEALLVCEQTDPPFDLLITDVVMPRMSGRQLADRIRKSRPDLRVLYMSGYTDDTILQYGGVEGDASFLHKPFTADALARKVRDILDSDA